MSHKPTHSKAENIAGSIVDGHRSIGGGIGIRCEQSPVSQNWVEVFRDASVTVDVAGTKRPRDLRCRVAAEIMRVED